MKISALVPVKNLDTAKSRLADVLSRNERRMLADLMLSDVVEVILKNPKIEGFLVGDKQLSPSQVPLLFRRNSTMAIMKP